MRASRQHGVHGRSPSFPSPPPPPTEPARDGSPPCSKSGRDDVAKGHLTQSLQLNPLLWTAFEQLCQLGPEPALLAAFDGAHTIAAASALVARYELPLSASTAGAATFVTSAPAAAASAAGSTPMAVSASTPAAPQVAAVRRALLADRDGLRADLGVAAMTPR